MLSFKERMSLSVVLAAFLSVSLTAGISRAEESASLQKGIGYYKEESYDEALPLLKKARQEDPSSSLTAYYLGITYKKLQNYSEAKTYLIESVSLTPKIKEALVELIDVLYQLNDIKEAKRYIKIAEAERIKPAQTAFLKGLVLSKDNDPAGAIAAFEEAKNIDHSLTQAADYQIGLAYIKDKKFDLAKKTFRDIIVMDPNSELAEFSNEYIEAMKRKEKAEKPFNLRIGTYGEYDTNVLLKPSDTTVAADITDESDWREVVTAVGEYRQKLTDRLSISPQYSLYWAHQNKIGIYDVLSHTFTVTPNYYLDKGTVGLAAGYNYTEVGEEKYLTTISASPVINYMIANGQMLQANFKYQDNNFSRKPALAEENRDSNNYGGGVGWYRFFADNKGFFGVRYGINKDYTKGKNWEYLGNRFSATVLYPFFDKFKLSVAGDIYLQDFDSTHSIFGVKRDDKTYTASTMLAYNFWKEAELQFRYTYVKDRSNIKIYDYDRSIYGFGIEYKF